jgi:hypothetical protein
MFESVFVVMGQGAFSEAVPLTPGLLSSLYGVPRLLTPVESLESILAEGGELAPRPAPWADSFQAAPRETVAAIGPMLTRLMLATSDLSPDSIRLEGLEAGTRAHAHLAALKALWAAHPAIMPPDLQILRHVLGAPADDVLQPVTVLHDPSVSRLSPAEAAVVAVLAARHGRAGPDDPRVQALIRAPVAPLAPEDSVLGEVQRRLLADGVHRRPPDETLHVLTVRDVLQEAEIAVGIVQSLLAADETLRPVDIALVIPDGQAYAAHLTDLLDLAGLRASGLAPGPAIRDLGAELLGNFLLSRRRPAPAMAMASLVVSPLMPWTMEIGREMARAIMDGDVALSRASGPASRLNAPQARLWATIRAPAPTTREALAHELDILSSHLSTESFWLEAGVEIAALAARLRVAGDSAIDWDDLLRRAPRPGPGAMPRPARYLGAPTVLRPGEPPPRPCRRMIVLGFNEGAYPAPPAANPFFLDSEIAAINQACGVTLESQASVLRARLEDFRRQIAQASDGLVILASTRDRQGKALALASSLALIARCVAGVTEPDQLQLDLGSADAQRWPALVARAAKPPASPSRLLAPPEPLEIGQDLLAIRRDAGGALRPQSPSRLETLIVSPLAWLLNEMGATPAYWAPETLTVALKGSVAHVVFERLFPPDAPIPGEADIEAALPLIYQDVVAGIAPFLRAESLSLEHDNLRAEILAAARRWAATLAGLGATVIGAEFSLRGEVDGLPVRGLADCLLRLTDGQLVIVDHKKSGSGTRRDRMAAGWDLQVELYRRMLEQDPGPDDPTPPIIREALNAAGRRAGVAYHLMNDGVVLVSGLPDLSSGPLVEVMKDDIAREAMGRLRETAGEVRAGRLRLNAAGDETTTQKRRHMGLYAFESSPLVRAFMISDGGEDQDDGGADD